MRSFNFFATYKAWSRKTIPPLNKLLYWTHFRHERIATARSSSINQQYKQTSPVLMTDHCKGHLVQTKITSFALRRSISGSQTVLGLSRFRENFKFEMSGVTHAPKPKCIFLINSMKVTKYISRLWRRMCYRFKIVTRPILNPPTFWPADNQIVERNYWYAQHAESRVQSGELYS